MSKVIKQLKRVYHKSLFTYDAMVKSAENAKGTPLTEEERIVANTKPTGNQCNR